MSDAGCEKNRIKTGNLQNEQKKLGLFGLDIFIFEIQVYEYIKL